MSWSTALRKSGTNVKDDIGKLSHVFWMSFEQIAIARRFAYLIFHDNTYQGNRYNLNIGLFVGVKNIGQSVVMGQTIVVGQNITDFEYQFTHLLAAVGIAPVVMFTGACDKASAAVATVFPNAKHFWYYWCIAKNVAKNLKGVVGHDTFNKLVASWHVHTANSPLLSLSTCGRLRILATKSFQVDIHI